MEHINDGNVKIRLGEVLRLSGMSSHAYDKGVSINEVDHEWLDGYYRHEVLKGRMVNGVASQLDIPTDVIGRMLGHADPAHSTTDIYINFDMRKVDAAMRRVIDYINAL